VSLAHGLPSARTASTIGQAPLFMYNAQLFFLFRVIPGFVVQFGISAYPAGFCRLENANIKDEPVVGATRRGYLTYAKTSIPNTRSTQIFINLKDNAGLDRQGFFSLWRR